MVILGCMLGWLVSTTEMMVNKMVMLGCTHHSKETTLSSKMNGGSKITCKKQTQQTKMKKSAEHNQSKTLFQPEIDKQHPLMKSLNTRPNEPLVLHPGIRRMQMKSPYIQYNLPEQNTSTGLQKSLPVTW